jgi:hypothetical protein
MLADGVGRDAGDGCGAGRCWEGQLMMVAWCGNVVCWGRGEYCARLACVWGVDKLIWVTL